jgi:hypothetical protein
VQPNWVCVTLKFPAPVTRIVWLFDPLDQVFPDVADELRVKLFPEHNNTVPPGVIIGTFGIGLTVRVMAALVAVFGLEQGELEVIMQLTIAPLVRVEEVKTELLLPVLTPFTFHWYAGFVPPLPGCAVKDSSNPAQRGLVPELRLIVTEEIRIELTVMVMPELTAVGVIAQVELEVISQLTILPLLRELVV